MRPAATCLSRAPERNEYGAVTGLMSAAAGRKRQRKSAAPRPLAHRTDIRSPDGGDLGSSDMVSPTFRSSAYLCGPLPCHGHHCTIKASPTTHLACYSLTRSSGRTAATLTSESCALLIAVSRVVAANTECRAYRLQWHVLASAVRSSSHSLTDNVRRRYAGKC